MNCLSLANCSMYYIWLGARAVRKLDVIRLLSLLDLFFVNPMNTFYLLD